MELITTFGLVANLAGMLIVAFSVVETREESAERALGGLGGPPEEVLALPSVQKRIGISTCAKVGAILVTIGTALQILATWAI